MPTKKLPLAVFSDGKGNIYEDPRYTLAGRSGHGYYPVSIDDMIELPSGSDLFELPGRKTLGYTMQGELETLPDGIGAAAFSAPAHTLTYLAAYETAPGAPVLPLYAYASVGWYKNKFYVSATRVDPDGRQDAENFDHKVIIKRSREILKKYPNNRLVQHLIDNCALTYICPAARNFVMGRWECPIPSSPGCNSNCIGCISLQPADESPVRSTQDRIQFVPTPEEIAEFAVYHLEHAERPIVSFGQGCEGEPLLVWPVLKEAIQLIRKKTDKGIININSNASKPEGVEELCRVGLRSLRISMNSAQRTLYNRYYIPNNYVFEDLIESAKVMRKHGGWVSINYFTMPGVTDTEPEQEALFKFIESTDLNMIQWRNFNIDPDWYFKKVGLHTLPPPIGIRHIMADIKSKFPHIAFGYFNPPEEVQASYRTLKA